MQKFLGFACCFLTIFSSMQKCKFRGKNIVYTTENHCFLHFCMKLIIFSSMQNAKMQTDIIIYIMFPRTPVFSLLIQCVFFKFCIPCFSACKLIFFIHCIYNLFFSIFCMLPLKEFVLKYHLHNLFYWLSF